MNQIFLGLKTSQDAGSLKISNRGIDRWNIDRGAAIDHLIILPSARSETDPDA